MPGNLERFLEVFKEGLEGWPFCWVPPLRASLRRWHKAVRYSVPVLPKLLWPPWATGLRQGHISTDSTLGSSKGGSGQSCWYARAAVWTWPQGMHGPR